MASFTNVGSSFRPHLRQSATTYLRAVITL